MRPLTANEQEFLRFCARDDDHKDRVKKWRELRLDSHDKAQAAITRRIEKMLVRHDAKGFIEAERMRMEEQRGEAMRDADQSGWEEQRAKADLNRQVVDSLTTVLRARTDSVLAASGEKSAGDIAKLCEIGHKVAAQGADAPPLSAADLALLLKQAGLRKAEGETATADQGESPSVPKPVSVDEVLPVDPQMGIT